MGMLAMFWVLPSSNSNSKSHHQDDTKYALGDRESQPTEPLSTTIASWVKLRSKVCDTSIHKSHIQDILRGQCCLMLLATNKEYLMVALLILVGWLIWSYQQ